MNIRKINEELDKLLEISDKTKRHVVDKRKANWLAAQATADNLKAKYDKVKDKVNPTMTKAEYRDAAKDLSTEISHLFNNFPRVNASNGEYVIIFNLYDEWVDEDRNVNQSAIQQLEELLEKMTEEYGVKYSYEVNNNKVTIICEKPEQLEEPENAIQDILQGTYNGKELDQIVLENLDKFSIDQLVEILENYDYYNNCRGWALYPSGWHRSGNEEPYPEKLAQALCQSRENECEGLSDLFNIYYRDHGDMYTWGEAADIWVENAMNNIDSAISDLYDIDDDGEFVKDLIDFLNDSYPRLVNELKARYRF